MIERDRKKEREGDREEVQEGRKEESAEETRERDRRNFYGSYRNKNREKEYKRPVPFLYEKRFSRG